MRKTGIFRNLTEGWFRMAAVVWPSDGKIAAAETNLASAIFFLEERLQLAERLNVVGGVVSLGNSRTQNLHRSHA